MFTQYPLGKVIGISQSNIPVEGFHRINISTQLSCCTSHCDLYKMGTNFYYSKSVTFQQRRDTILAQYLYCNLQNLITYNIRFNGPIGHWFLKIFNRLDTTCQVILKILSQLVNILVMKLICFTVLKLRFLCYLFVHFL